jgi:LmbE family N-acetylglucosaminyl deacetylase
VVGGRLPPAAAICDITDVLEIKLEAIKRYETQLRPAPHIRSLEA